MKIHFNNLAYYFVGFLFACIFTLKTIVILTGTVCKCFPSLIDAIAF